MSEAPNLPASGGNASAHDFEVSHVPATPAIDLARKSLRLMDAPPKELVLTQLSPPVFLKQNQPEPQS
jgi:hypothetical protein